MNLLGKSLIVLIFVMSVFFMAASVLVFATHQNYKTLADATNQKLTAAQSDRSQLQAQRDQLERDLAMERAARAQAIAAAESALQQQTQEMAAMQKSLEETQLSARTLTAAVEAAAMNVDRLQQQLDNQKAESIKLLEDHREKFATVMKITDENSQLEAMLERIQTQARQLRDQLGIAEQVLSYNGLQPTAPVTGIAPQAEGEVQEVRDNRVMVSLGSDDGLRVGHELDISRGELYLGRIRIVKTATDRSVGDVLDGFRRGAIQRGDRVRTKVK